MARGSVTKVCLRHGIHEPKSSLSWSKDSLGFQENFFEEMFFFQCEEEEEYSAE